MVSKHSQENEELRQQRNHLEKISEELQEKLHKLKEESHSKMKDTCIVLYHNKVIKEIESVIYTYHTQ